MFKDKRFLITQPMIHGLNGSTIVALELADYLQSEGAKVNVYTYYYDNPAKKFYEKKNIKVLTAADDSKLSLTDFDYIWIHSQVLPISIVEQLGKNLPKKMPMFIFHHMSPFDWIPDERPYIYGLEEKISSRSLFVSDETKKALAMYYSSDYDLFEDFHNPAPVDFSTIKPRNSKTVQKILIVSNHPPEELKGAVKILLEKGIGVVSFGETSEKYSLVTPDVIATYDVVITIGKTVQYCLTAGVPVYVYDHFGGCGYLNGDNYKAAQERNFAGRETKSRQAEYIANDIINRYQDAIGYQSKYRLNFINNFSIDKVLPKVFKNIKPRQIKRFSQQYTNVVKSAQIFAKTRFEVGAHEWNGGKLNNQLNEELIAARNIISEKDQEIYRLRSSESFILGSWLLKPLGFLKRVVNSWKIK